MAEDTIALVGAENIEEIDNCITRVRLTVSDNSHLDRDSAQAIGYQGYVKTGTTQAHFIIGPESEVIANEMRRLLQEGFTGIAEEEVQEEGTEEVYAEESVEYDESATAEYADDEYVEEEYVEEEYVEEEPELTPLQQAKIRAALRKQYRESTMVVLKDVAKQLELTGYSTLKKEELIKKILKATDPNRIAKEMEELLEE